MGVVQTAFLFFINDYDRSCRSGDHYKINLVIWLVQHKFKLQR